MPKCSDGVSDMFYKYEWNFTQYRADCERVYRMTPGLHKIRDSFGGRDITTATNILFTNGDMDPWKSGEYSLSVDIVDYRGIPAIRNRRYAIIVVVPVREWRFYIVS